MTIDHSETNGAQLLFTLLKWLGWVLVLVGLAVAFFTYRSETGAGPWLVLAICGLSLATWATLGLVQVITAERLAKIAHLIEAQGNKG